MIFLFETLLKKIFINESINISMKLARLPGFQLVMFGVGLTFFKTTFPEIFQ